MIRKATVNDADAVFELRTQLHIVHAEGRADIFNADNITFTKKEIKKWLKAKSKMFFVAENNGKVIGYCSATLSEKYYNLSVKSAFIDDLYVVPQERNKGIATALFNELKSYAEEWGAVKLDLCVWDFNQQAKAFYERLGMNAQRTILEMKI